MASVEVGLSCYCCGGPMQIEFDYSKPPERETRFSFSDSDQYHREFHRCDRCGHYQAKLSMDVSEMYSDEYVNSTYGENGIARTFDRIISLSPGRSDNIGRCEQVNRVARGHFKHVRLEGESSDVFEPTILDVGSGLCVFLHQMKKLGWKGTALDPDARAVAHAKDVVQVETLCGDFFKVQPPSRYDVLSLNKVLEHVEDPAAMLSRAADYIVDDGLVYVEVPDGEMAAREGADREEFFVEHLHCFSLVSLAMTAQRAGFDVKQIERLQEPSTKYTLRMFLTKK